MGEGTESVSCGLWRGVSLGENEAIMLEEDADSDTTEADGFMDLGRNRTNCKRTAPLNEKLTSESFIK